MAPGYGAGHAGATPAMFGELEDVRFVTGNTIRNAAETCLKHPPGSLQVTDAAVCSSLSPLLRPRRGVRSSSTPLNIFPLCPRHHDRPRSIEEATSHLDAVNEAEVRGALDRLMRGRTTLVIAHHLSTIRNADLIVVLDEGRVVERGTHATLLALDDLYSHLIGAQLHSGVRPAGIRQLVGGDGS